LLLLSWLMGWWLTKQTTGWMTEEAGATSHAAGSMVAHSLLLLMTMGSVSSWKKHRRHLHLRRLVGGDAPSSTTVAVVDSSAAVVSSQRWHFARDCGIRLVVLLLWLLVQE
jgi:hypothetical protein